MVSRIEIYTNIFDARAEAKIKQIKTAGFEIQKLEYVDVYTIEKDFSGEDLRKIVERLANPITQSFKVRTLSAEHSQNEKEFNLALEIGFLPGVTDNVATTTKELISDLLKIDFKEGNVFSSTLLLLSGEINVKNAQVLGESLANTLIQRIHYKGFEQYKAEGGMDFIVPKVSLEDAQKVLEVDLNVPDEELIKIGKEGILDPSGSRRGPLALNLDYMKVIQGYFKTQGRNPTDIELEALAQTWSEHCKHTIFADPIDDAKDGLFKTYIKRATEEIVKKKKGFTSKVFTDNSGALNFDGEYLITHKVETHNTPSALDPFGGAITGIVGVNRDALGFGLGAKPIFNTYGFCFAPPEDDAPLYKDRELTQKMLSPRRIMEGVIAGVNAGGNQSGIPTPQGFLYFDHRYKGKPLVFVGTVGLIPKKIGSKSGESKKAQEGDYIVMLGGRVGIDGIHGATFSSEALSTGSPSTAVQIGDPITQKKFSDAIIREARDRGLFNSITDNGAGGLSSSVAEMAKESGGCEVWLDKVPLKYPGLEPWQIWISESQERMTLSVPKDKWKEFESLMARRGTEATIIGEFTSSGRCIVKYNRSLSDGTLKDENILDMDMEFLHDGLPKRIQKAELKVRKFEEPRFDVPQDMNNIFSDMAGRLNVCGYDFISTQFDHTVQGLAVTYPVIGKGRVNSEVAVVRPMLDLEQGIVLSQGMYPHYSDIDTYHMAASSIDTAFKNAIVAGADPGKIALLDNFCWRSSDEAQSLGELKRACEACFDYAVEYETPFISGKDSMFNDFKGYDSDGKEIKISVPPTLLISSIGIIGNIKNAITFDFKFAGDLIYILGETFDELGGSEYFRLMDEKNSGNHVPKVDAKKNKKLYLTYAKAVEQGVISSGIGVNIGGLGVALAKSAIAGDLGCEISLQSLPGKVTRDDFALFSESQGRILVSIDPNKKLEFEKLFKGNIFSEIGKVTNDSQIKIKGLSNELVVSAKVDKILDSYKERFKGW